MAKVRVYVGSFCPYCTRAKALLKQKGVDFEEIDISRDMNAREIMMKESGGARSVPQIFIGETHVGGCDDLYALDKAGKLDPLLAA